MGIATDGSTFPLVMRALRISRGWSQRRLAEELAARGERGFSIATLSRIETGVRPTAPRERRAIVEALDVPLEAAEALAATLKGEE